jgi:hypothetical protein
MFVISLIGVKNKILRFQDNNLECYSWERFKTNMKKSKNKDENSFLVKS